MRTATRVGLLGGSFNPAHAGHRRVSLFALQALGLDEIWWLVSPGNPLKAKRSLAPLPVRYASAVRMARRARIRASVIERDLGTRFTVDTVQALQRRYAGKEFVWLMGSDNLAQFHLWRDWRGIARRLPIAVIARPGYDAAALASPAMAWLRRFRRPAASFAQAGKWSAPALVLLRFDPDERSATAIRQSDPDWVVRHGSQSLRDQVTHRRIGSARETQAP